MNKYFKRTARSGARHLEEARSRVKAKIGHNMQRQGDECACSCGARWPADEEHP